MGSTRSTVWTLNIELNTNPELVPLPGDGTWVRFYYPDTEETVENLFYYNAATGRKLKTVVDNSKSWLTAESYAHYFEVFKGYIDAKPAGWTFVPPEVRSTGRHRLDRVGSP